MWTPFQRATRRKRRPHITDVKPTRDRRPEGGGFFIAEDFPNKAPRFFPDQYGGVRAGFRAHAGKDVSSLFSEAARHAARETVLRRAVTQPEKEKSGAAAACGMFALRL